MKKVILIFALFIFVNMVACSVDTNNKNISASKNKNDNWVIKEYVDEFKEATGKKYIINKEKFKGSFNNSFAKDDDLYVQVLYDDSDDMYFYLYEYYQSSSSSKYQKSSLRFLKSSKVGTFL